MSSSEHKGIVSFFIERPMLVQVFIIIVFVTGFFAFTQMTRNQMPDVDMKRLSIITLYPGASPQDVELKVTKQIEDKVKTVAGVKRVTSQSSTNSSLIMVDIVVDDPDTDGIKTDIRNEVKSAEQSLPTGATVPYVQDIDPTVAPIVSYMISSNQISEFQLRRASLDLENLLRSVPGVKDVIKSGFRDREYQIFTDIKKINRKQTTLSDINTSIQNYNVRNGGGAVDQNDKHRTIVTESLFKSIQDVSNLTIRENFQGESVKVKDVGFANYGFAFPTRYARSERSSGVLLQVLKQGSVDIISTVKSTDEIVRNVVPIFQKRFGHQMQIIKTFDQTPDIKDMLKITTDSAWQGFLLVYIILLIFLDRRTAFWAAFNIPMSMLMTFVIIRGSFGFGFDMMTLFGLITVLGIVVDQGIVVAENVYQKIEQGYSPKEATILGTNEIAKAIIAAVATTVMAFVPLMELGDIVGEFIRPLPIVVVVALLCSTIEVFVSLPTHIMHSAERKLAKFKKKHGEDAKVRLSDDENDSLGFFSKGYRGLLRVSLKFRYGTIIIFILALMFSLKIAKGIPFVFFSNEQQTELQIQLTAKPSFTLDQTLEVAKHIENSLVEEVPYGKELRTITTQVGIRKDDPTNPNPEQANTAYISALLVPYSDRHRNIESIANAFRAKLDKDPLVKASFDKYIIAPRQSGPPSDADFQWRLSSNDTELLTKVTNDLETFVKKLTGVYGVENTAKWTQKQLGVYSKQDMMYRLGVNPAAVSNTISIAYSGARQSNYIPDIDDPIYVRLALAEKYQRSQTELNNLLIPASAKQVKLSQVAMVKEEVSPISYFHYNGRRSYTVNGFVNGKVNTPLAVDAAIRTKFLPKYKDMPNLWISQSGQGETMGAAFSGAAKAAVLGMIGIFLILIITLDSIVQSAFLMFVIPFSLIGVFLGFYLHSEPLGFFAIIGILGLAGVVVNHAVVLVDIINVRMKQNHVNLAYAEGYRYFLVDACETRLRPIVLTTLCTVVGLLPGIYGWGGSNDFLKPLGIALGDGLLIGGFVTVVLIPCLYHVQRDFSALGMKFKNLAAEFVKKEQKILNK